MSTAMSRTVFQEGLQLWGSEFGLGTPKSAPNFGMDFERAIFSSGVTEAFLENSRATKEPGTPNGDDFLFDDLLMLSCEEIAAPISSLKLNLPICQTPDFSVVMSEDVSSGAISEQSCSQDGQSKELECFSTVGEDALIFGGLNFRGDSFLIQGVREIPYESRIEELHGPMDSSKNRITSAHEKHVESWNDVFALESPVPGRSRSKRSRSGARKWSSGDLHQKMYDISTLTNSSQPLLLDFQYLSHKEEDRDELFDVEVLLQRSETSSNTKKARNKASRKKNSQENGQARRCAHCLSQKTPQWRLGPTGPKSLCNACGVRFKSGRLFPEYMPAKSPSFSIHCHSNSHRKVLEMRHQKELEVFEQQRRDCDE